MSLELSPGHNGTVVERSQVGKTLRSMVNALSALDFKTLMCSFSDCYEDLK